MTILFSIMTWLMSPIGRIAGIVLSVALAAGVIYGKGRYDDHVAFKEKIQRESTKAVEQADTARNAANKQFDAGGLRNDGYRRDQ